MGSEGVEDILKFLDRGDQMIRYSPSQEAILVMGNTGTGKSTLSHFLALNNDNMISKPRGVGDFTVEDDTQGICESTIESCTVIPELLISEGADKTTYYDCPGFSDTRSVSHDIGVSYFIQKVIRRVNSVKIVFTISYDSVRQGGDRQAFMHLAKNIHSMFTNITKFNKSICLLVTKVENIMTENEDGTYRLVPDEVMIQNIVGFLKKAKDDLNADLTTKLPLEKKKWYETAVTIIDIFSNDGQLKYPKIGIFRRPNTKGPLSKMKVLQRGKVAMHTMIYQLEYTMCNQEDFGYTISDNSKLYLNGLKTGINENIKQKISKTGQQLLENYIHQEKNSRDIGDLVDKITTAFNELSKLSSANDTPRDFIEKTIATVNKLKVEMSAENVQQINNFCGYLEFIESLEGKPTNQFMQWGYNLKDVVSYLRESHEWYGLLIELRAISSGYTIQQNIGRYDDVTKKLVSDITDLNQAGVLVSLRQFLSMVNKDSEMKYEIPSMKILDETKLRFLQELLEISFAKINWNCADHKLVVKGNIIMMKDVVALPCYGQSQTVDVFGLSKVFVDVNIDKKEGLLRIFSPTFQVVNEPTLMLDGKDGLDHVPPKQGEGKPGLPGNPGGPAGSFVGIGQICNNCNKLNISAVGGKGGKGQDGSDGVPGKDGASPDVIDNLETSDSWRWTWRKQGFTAKCEIYSKNCSPGTLCISTADIVRCTIPGKPGEKGGKGGDGGRGGEGGHAGQVSLVFGGTHSSEEVPSIAVLNGHIGDGGSGGKGGLGGYQGATLTQSKTVNLVIPWGQEGPHSSYKQEDNRTGPHGDRGKDNCNTEKLIHPKTVNFDSTSRSINQYKTFLRQNMENSMNNAVLRNFLEYIEVDQRVNRFYNTTDFVDDLIVMERQTYGHQMSAVNVRSYRTFLDRITKYAQTLGTEGTSDENKLVLAYLYTSILSKICRIQESSNIRLVIDIKGYLKKVNDATKQLEDFKNVVQKNKSKSNYQKMISDKIDEANNLINKEILPEIDNTILQLTDDMQSLLNETIALEKEAEANKAKLRNYRNKLQSQMTMSTVFSIVQGVGQALGVFLGPVGNFIGPAIGLVSTVAQDLTNDAAKSSEVPRPISQLPDGVNKCLEELKTKYNKNQELYQRQLSKAEEILDEFTDISMIVDLMKKINQTKTELKEATRKAAGGDHAAIEKSYETKKNLNKSMKETLLQLAKQKETSRTDESKIDKGINAVSKIKSVLKVAAMTGIDFFEKVKKAKSSIKTVDEALEAIEEHTLKLKQYEKAIYSTILPMAEAIKDKADNAVKTSAGKSHTALDVSSWKVQSAIRQVKTQLKDMTDGFKTQGKILNTIDNVMYGMTMMIHVYDNIQDYYDRAQLADYIRDITSDQANSINVIDVSLQEAIDKLKFEMQNNFVLSEYERSVSALRQYVFPFGNYISQYNLPIEFLVANASHTIAEVISNISTAVDRLEKEVTVIQSDDKNIFPKQIYNSQDDHNPPFYVWKYSSIKGQLGQLFQGKEVMMNADIARGIKQNAIKFDRIGVHFKSKCSQIQTELNEALKGFSIKLIHLGNSHYRCGHRVFTMTHGNIEIQHSVKKQDGKYFNQNKVYEKLIANDPILSPYSMWKMQLTGRDFNELAQFIGPTIDIELEGRGSYLNHEEDDDICTDELKRYYDELTDSTIQITDDSAAVVDIDDMGECKNQNTSRAMPHHILRKRHNFINESKPICGPCWLPYGTDLVEGSNSQSALQCSPCWRQSSRAFTSESETAVHSHMYGGNARTSSIQPANTTLLDVNSTLLLMDTLIRRLNGTSRQRGKINPKDEEYAHRMAYSAHTPQN